MVYGQMNINIIDLLPSIAHGNIDTAHHVLCEEVEGVRMAMIAYLNQEGDLQIIDSSLSNARI